VFIKTSLSGNGMEHISQVGQTLIALKDNPIALVALIALCALGVTAYAIRAVIVALNKRGGNP
jgi:hypothetical protein